MIEVVTTFQKEETVWILAYVYNQRTGAPAGPTAITLTLSGPDGVAVFPEPVAMSEYTEGEYQYFYTLPPDAKRGWWRGLVKVVDGSVAGGDYKATIATFGFRIK